jgi:hypothetical protein
MRQIGFKDASAQFFGRISNGVDRTDDAVHQLVHVERAAVSEVSFGQRPNSFVGVEVGSVGGKVLDVQARVSAEEPGERWPVVGGGVVEQNDDGTAEVAEQFAEKSTYFFLSDIVEEEQIVEAQVLSLGTDRDSRDDGDFVAASLAMTLQGRAPLGSPGSDHQGSQQEARFIGKN